MSNIIPLSRLSMIELVGHLNVQKIQIISSCTMSKTMDCDDRLYWEDFEKGEQWVKEREAGMDTVAAEQLYAGRQHTTVIEMIEAIPGVEFDLKIVSAGYGLIQGAQKIAPYNVTFTGLTKAEIARRSIILGLPQAFREAVEQTDADLTLILLGKSYLEACGVGQPMFPTCPTLFVGNSVTRHELEGCNLYQIPLDNSDCEALGAGQVWVKAEVARQIIQGLAA